MFWPVYQIANSTLIDLPQLLGHKVDLDMIQSNPACRLDKKMGKELVGKDAIAE